MPAREHVADRGRRIARHGITEVVNDLRATGLALGLTQRQISIAAGISRSYLGRVERDEVGAPRLEHLAAVAAALGLRLRVALFPDGEAIRDRVQLRLLDAFRSRLHPSIGWRTEVPLPIPGDRRAWDAVAIADDGWTGIEAVSRLGAVDATLRAANQKQRDDPRIARVVLVVADTARNRAALRLGVATIRADFPLQTRDSLAALAVGRSPALNGIVLLRAPAARVTGWSSREGHAARPQVVHSGAKLVDAAAPARPQFVENPVGATGPGPYRSSCPKGPMEARSGGDRLKPAPPGRPRSPQGHAGVV